MGESAFLGAILVLPVGEMQRARDWYAEVLGFRTVYLHHHPREDPRGNYAVLRRDEAEVHLILDEPPRHHPWTAVGTGYLFLTVRGVEEVYRKIQARGVALTREMRRESWGARAFQLTDPSGNLILVAEEAAPREEQAAGPPPLAAPERVETARLLLRRPRLEDAAEIFARYASDPEVTRFLAWPTHESVAQTEAFLRASDLEWTREGAGPYLVVDRRDGRLLGGTGLEIEAPYRATTGYVFARDAWGRGYATEALAAVVEVARARGLVRLHAVCHAEHRASRRVLEKCGFQREGRLRNHFLFPNLSPRPCDVLAYGTVLR